MPRKKITINGPSMIFSKFKIFISWVKSRLQNSVFNFFCTSETYFSKLTLTHLNNSFTAHFLVVTKNNLPPLAHAPNFETKIPFSHPNRDFKSLFFIFSFFRDLHFKCDFYPLEQFSLAHLLVVIREKFISCGVSTLQKN